MGHCLSLPEVQGLGNHCFIHSVCVLVVSVRREKLVPVTPLWLEAEPFDTETSQGPEEKEGCTVSFWLSLLFHSLGPPDSPPSLSLHEKLIPKIQIL